MNDVPLWLNLPLGLLGIACWVGGTFATFRATREAKAWPRWLWRTAVIGFPISAFLVFAIRDRLREPLAAPRLTWTWLAAHVLLIALGIPAYLIARNRSIVHVDVSARRAPPHSEEWWSAESGGKPPALCVAMSGGGIRSAAFNIGVLRALHEKGLLAKTDVMAAVSGGSYALSWYLLQQYYASIRRDTAPSKATGDALLKEMFDPNGIYQQHLAANARSFEAKTTTDYYFALALAAVLDLSAYNAARILSTLGNEHRRNLSGAREAYRRSIQNTFHLVSKSENNKTTVYNAYQLAGNAGAFGNVRAIATRYAMHVNLSIADEVTFAQLAEFAREKNLPFFVFVTTVHNDLPGQPGTNDEHPNELWPSVFELNGWGLGSDSYGYTAWSNIPNDVRFAAVRLVNVAPAISGAALSPASGGLTPRTQRIMSLGNVDLGYRVPRFNDGEVGSLYLSDGGHSENLGLYPLVRRGCQNIIAIDAEHEPTVNDYQFKGYRKAQKALAGDFARTMWIEAIDPKPDPKPAGHAVMKGTISGADASAGQPAEIYYVKLAMIVDERMKQKYRDTIGNVDLGPSFPQDPTTDQNFDDFRFRAYRELGHLIAKESLLLDGLSKKLKATPRP